MYVSDKKILKKNQLIIANIHFFFSSPSVIRCVSQTHTRYKFQSNTTTVLYSYV